MRLFVMLQAVMLLGLATMPTPVAHARSRVGKSSSPSKEAPAGRWRPRRLDDADSAAATDDDSNADSDSDPMAEMYRDRGVAEWHARVEHMVFVSSAGLLLVVGFVGSFARSRRKARRNRERLRAAREEGRDQPASLHPHIDHDKCIGCGACVEVCPDQTVLGTIEGKSHLILASNCIGHGSCAKVCPVDAIELVFGTVKRPFDLPRMDDLYQSNVPGMYVAGELGGMGLIANALEQGIEAASNAAQDLAQDPAAPAPGGNSADRVIDLLIVGGGPAGIGASLRAQELGLRYLCVDQESWGGAVRSFPRAKIVMTRPLRLPLYGPVKLRETTKEALVELFRDIVEQTSLRVRADTRVTDVRHEGGAFLVETSAGMVRARRVIMAIGRRGTPRKLGVPGEDQSHVAYTMLEPEKWAGQRIAVIGGGDVACEIALALAEQPGTEVAMIYRGKSLSRPKAANRQRIEDAAASGQLRLLLGTDIAAIEKDAVRVVIEGREGAVPAQQVFICAGGQPPNEFLKKIGIEVVSLAGKSMDQVGSEVGTPAGGAS